MDASIWSNELIEVCCNILILSSILKMNRSYCFTHKKTEHIAAEKHAAVTVNLIFLGIMYLCVI